MAHFLSKTDFVGLYAINQQLNDGVVLNAFIEEYEKQYLAKVLGVELMKLLYEESPESRITKLIQPITEGEFLYGGVKSILKGLIYFEYTTNNESKSTGAGFKSLQTETAKNVKTEDTQVYKLYNIGIKNSRELQKYICENKETYPEYDGKELLYNSWF